MPFPECPDSLPNEINDLILDVCRRWKEHDLRPDIDNTSLIHWDSLISEWINNFDLPLLIRKASLGRGTEITHLSGRKIIPTDNSPAGWSFYSAFNNLFYEIDDIYRIFENDEIPIAMALSRDEKNSAVYTNTNRSSINKNNWKICHIDPVGMYQNPLELSINLIENHFRKFLSPSNMFLVPKYVSGLGELPQMIEVMREE